MMFKPWWFLWNFNRESPHFCQVMAHFHWICHCRCNLRINSALGSLSFSPFSAATKQPGPGSVAKWQESRLSEVTACLPFPFGPHFRCISLSFLWAITVAEIAISRQLPQIGFLNWLGEHFRFVSFWPSFFVPSASQLCSKVAPPGGFFRMRGTSACGICIVSSSLEANSAIWCR